MTDEQQYEKTLQANPQYWSKLTDEFTARVKSSADGDVVSGMIKPCGKSDCSVSTGIQLQTIGNEQ